MLTLLDLRNWMRMLSIRRRKMSLISFVESICHPLEMADRDFRCRKMNQY